ncbi:hypothetical protein [Nocardia sp.]|nr:hypothetical protein [Nocardia sp.]
MRDLVSGSSGWPQQSLTGTVTSPTTLFLETGDKVTSDCMPSALH